MTGTKTEDGILQALLAVQADPPELHLDAENPHFHSRYLSLGALMERTLPKLTANGLVWVTLPGDDERGPFLIYRLMHTSGESIEGRMPLMLQKQDPQGLGSAITYARRYSLMAVLGLVADEDDDGNKASEPQRANGRRVTAGPPRATESVATAKQRGLLNAKASEKGLNPELFANIILVAAGQESRDLEPGQGEQLVNRLLDRLPARLVTPVLEGIDKAEADAAIPF